jgi:hypothetical protein
VPFETQPDKHHVLRLKSEAGPLPRTRLSKSPTWHSNQGHPGSWAAAHASCAKAVLVRTLCFHECVFILEHYFASKSFAAVREAFSNACPDKKIRNKTTIHELLTKFRDRKERDCCFQRDGATAHTANTTALLQEFFGESTVGRGLWPQRPPDLTLLTSFWRGGGGVPSKEEFIRITHETCRNWNTILNRRLPTLKQKYFAKSHERTKRGGCSSSRRWWTFSASAIKLFDNYSQQIRTKKSNSFPL